MRTTRDAGFALPAIDAGDGFRDALAAGLSGSPKTIPCKFFYDSTGGELFERICQAPEYYLTRTELSLLRAHAHEITAFAGPDVEIIEFGAGMGEKIRILLDVLERPRGYFPVDISASSLGTMVERLQIAYPALSIHPIAADFTNDMCWPSSAGARRLGFFPGSTIGNFKPAEAREFLSRAAGILSGGGLLIGVDLVKEPGMLHAAYNDAAGLTAAFNLNLLIRANRETGANFDVSRYFHYAFYNPVRQRIEMYLVSKIEQDVTIFDRTFTFAEGEAVLTEFSYKYSVEGFRSLAAAAGFTPRAVWFDAQKLFSIHWLEAR